MYSEFKHKQGSLWGIFFLFLFFVWTKVYFVEPLIAPVLDLVCVLPHGIQIQSGYLVCTLSRLHAMILKVTTGATPSFSTNRGVHCISVYTGSYNECIATYDWISFHFVLLQHENTAMNNCSEMIYLLPLNGREIDVTKRY